MSNSTFSGPVRATDGFLEKDEAGNWVPVSGGGGGPAITFGGMFGGSSWDGSTPIAVAIQPSGVVAGVYDNPTITVNAEGRITNAVNGTLPSAPNGVKIFLVNAYAGGGETSMFFYQQLPANARVVDIAIRAQAPSNYPSLSESTLKIGGVDAMYVDFRSAAIEVGGNAFFNGNPGVNSGYYYNGYTYPDGSSAVPLDITLSNPSGLGNGTVELVIQYIDMGA